MAEAKSQPKEDQTNRDNGDGGRNGADAKRKDGQGEDKRKDEKREDKQIDRKREDKQKDRKREDKQIDRKREDKRKDEKREDKQIDRKREDKQIDRKREDKRKDEKREDKHPQTKKKPANKKSKESEQRDKGDNHTHDKDTPGKKTWKGNSKATKKISNVDSKQNPEDTKHDAENENTLTTANDESIVDQNENQENAAQTNDSAQNHEEDDEACKVGRQKKNSSLDDDSLQMFLSTDDVGDDQHQPWMGHNQYSDETKRKQEEIIRRILEDFDLEETMRRYRNSSTVVIRRDGKSLADFRFRSELIRMMGSEEIRLNDQEWSKKFQDRLKDDYDRLLDDQERSLAREEKHRQHRLRVEGVIQKKIEFEDLGTPHDSAGDLRAHKTHHALAHSTRKKTKKKKDTEPRPIFSNEESLRKERVLYAQRQERNYWPYEDVKTQVGRLEKEEVEERKEEEMDMKYQSRSNTLAASMALVAKEKDHFYALSTSSSLKGSVEDLQKDIQADRRKQIYKNLPPNIARLYAEETTSGLYEIAQEVLYPKTPDPPDPMPEQKKGVRIA